MNDLFYDKLDKVLDAIDNNKKIVRMKKLKEEIYKDNDLKKYLEEFKKEEENPYSSRYVELKTKILDNGLVVEYKKLEKELYFIVLEINKRLNELLDKKSC